MTTPPNNPYPGSSDPNDPQQPQYGQNPPQYGQNPPQQPQYGQNLPYGQNPPQYGQNLPQYGQQPYGYPAQPGGYGYPGQQGGPAQAAPVPPKEVLYSFYLILAAGALFFIGNMAASLGATPQLVQQQLEDFQAQSGTAVDLEAFMSVYRTVGVVIAALFAGLYVLIAFMIKKGRNWARVLGAVFAGLSLFGIAGGLLPLLYVLLGVAGVVMAFLKPSSEYFRAVAARKFGYRG